MITHRIRPPVDLEGSTVDTFEHGRITIEERFAPRSSDATSRWFVVLLSGLSIARILFSRSQRHWLARPIAYAPSGEELRGRRRGALDVPRGILGSPVVRRWGDLIVDRDRLFAFVAKLPLPIHLRAAKKKRGGK